MNGEIQSRFPPVRNKTDFSRRYRKGEFGNASPSWDTYDDWNQLEVKPSGLYHLRNRKRGGATFYNLREEEVHSKFKERIDLGENGDTYYLSLMCPTEKTILQGEIQDTPGDGLYLNYTTVAKPMREALKESSLHARGVVAAQLLRWALCPNSLEWVQILLDRYPDHVIEFTALDCEWGTWPGYNTLFWEVRLY